MERISEEETEGQETGSWKGSGIQFSANDAKIGQLLVLQLCMQLLGVTNSRGTRRQPSKLVQHCELAQLHHN